jgi:translocator protein
MTMKASFRRSIYLVGFLLLSFAVAGLGSIFTRPSVGSWYLTLHKPPWTPPSWLFGPVWTVLYFMIGLSGWLVWQCKDDRVRSRALLVFVIQLMLNLTWSYVFFAIRSPLLGLLDITALWSTLGIYVLITWSGARLAALLFLPYWIWVSYAGILNYFIWWMNCKPASST